MFTRQNEISLFITDHRIGFYVQQENAIEPFKSGHVDLEPGILDNGNITEPELLFKKLQYLFKQHKIKARYINFVLHDQNILMRDLSIQKEDLDKKTIDQYILEQIGKSIHLPFETPITAHYKISEDDQMIKVLIVIANEDLLNDYVDVFDRLGAKNTRFNLPAADLYNYYLTKGNRHYDHLMMVTLHERMIMIKILQHGFPVFSMIEDSEESSNQYYDMMESLIERVINYYKFNINKGTATVEHIAFFNLSEDIPKKILSDKLAIKFKNHSYQMVDIDEPNLASYHTSKVVEMAYLGSIPRVSELESFKNVPFKLDRVHKLNVWFGYLNVLTFALFTTILLIYIPFATMREDIVNQTHLNNILSAQIESILMDMIPENPINAEENIHSETYDFLIEQEPFILDYVLWMENQLSPSVVLMNYTINRSDQTITMVITSDSLYDMNDSVLSIYEAHGIIDVVTESRFITDTPSSVMIDDYMMEVTIHYA
ncbi:MAG: hypothetical protein C4537_04885 [Acholeplasma sp.]|jgi:type IV pilus assembly protein PilM|nr:MAG: hypothetical protein C4537_04885 [Acholeplasma sp.]